MTQSAESMDPAVKAMADREGKYLTFSLADEEYGSVNCGELKQ